VFLKEEEIDEEGEEAAFGVLLAGCVCVCVCVSLCVCERERERESVCVCK
jgi:hypothetical protein